MGDHRTLDEFAADRSVDEGPDAPSPTYRWIPDGRPCDHCGEEVRGLWASDHGLRCKECKEW